MEVDGRLRLLPHLVHHYHIWVGPTLNQTTVCRSEIRPGKCLEDRLLAHSLASHSRIASIHPSSLPHDRKLSPSSQVAVLIVPRILTAEEADRPELVGRCHKRSPPRKACHST